MNADHHYWIVGGSSDAVYSSAVNALVSQSDEAYQSWLSAGGQTSLVSSEEQLWEVLSACRPGALPSWLFDGEHFIQPAPGAYRASQLRAYAAEARWRNETAGISIANTTIATDDRSKQMVLGLRVKADANPDFTTRFKSNDGTWFDVNAATIISISDAVFAHVDGAFSIEGDVVTQIEAGTITTTEQIDAAFA